MKMNPGRAWRAEKMRTHNAITGLNSYFQTRKPAQTIEAEIAT